MDNNKKAKKWRVLYFDDEPFINFPLAESLKLLNWDVTFVDSIDELFNKLNNHQFDILILDIMVPLPSSIEDYNHIQFSQSEIIEMREGMHTGVVLAKKIWSIENYLDIPILFLSAKRNPIPYDAFLQEKKCDYLRKPELAKEVSEALIRLLNYKI